MLGSSRLIKRQKRETQRRGDAKKKILILCVSLHGLTSCLNANPTDPQVMAGDALFLNNGQLLEIQASDNSIIHWKDFSIDTSETARFIQSGADSAVLNRVTGGNLSQILGQLQSNGKVYLINPNGILIGENAQIDTGSFIAATLDVLDSDFLKGGDIAFQGGLSGSLVNLGTIRAKEGDVFLIAHQVENRGTIEASNGVAGLAAGYEVLLQPRGAEKLFIRPSQQEGASIAQNGQIAAIQTEIKANGNPYDFAIRQSGKINATGIENRNGRILLVAENGKVEQKGTLTAQNGDQTGGEVQILGLDISIPGGTIDVAGDFGGGKVLIGGDFQGNNPEISNAYITFLDEDAIVHADARISGDGGQVIVWSDRYTRFKGNISAEGGKEKGNGGFVEVSGRELAFRGRVTTLAPQGLPGMLMLDPDDIIITSTPPSDGPPPPPANFTSFTGTVVGTSNLFNGDLITALTSGSVLVTVTTNPGSGGSGNITLQETGDILWGTPFTAASSTSLTLMADADIFIAASILNGDAGAITLSAVNNIFLGLSAPATPATQTAMVGSYMGATTLTTTMGGTIAIGDSTSTFPSQVGWGLGPNAAMDPVSGSITIDAATMGGVGNVTLTGGTTNTLVFAQVGHGEVLASPGGTLSGATGTILVTARGGGNITLVGGSTNDSYSQIGHGGAFVTNPTANDISGVINVTATGGSITLDGGVTLLATSCLSRIGHGGFGDGMQFNSAAFLDSITLTAGTEVRMDAGTADFNLVQIGHGISSTLIPAAPTTHGISGDIVVTSLTSFISFTGGTADNAFSQVGHGGFNLSNDTAPIADNIHVEATMGTLTLQGGPAGSFSSAMIGHGGGNNAVFTANTQTTTGDISISAMSGINLIGGAVGSSGNFSQIGHGGFGIILEDTISGDITVTMAGPGDLAITGLFANYAQIGHGGRSATISALPAAAIDGDIFVNFLAAGNATLTANDNMAMLGGILGISHIGHGGPVFIHGGDVLGDIFLSLPSGNAIIEPGTMSGGALNYVQIGHGGFNSGNAAAPNDQGGLSGAISLTLDDGFLTFNSNFLVNPTDISNYTLIGHGGQSSRPDFMSGDITVDVSGTAPNGNINLFVSPTAQNNAFAQIGHGGNGTRPGFMAAIPTGTISGTINVTAAESILLFAGGAAGNSNTPAHIGHIGNNADMQYGAGSATGDINVTASNGLLFLSGGSGSEGCSAQVGHGGLGRLGTIIGTISGAINVNVPNGPIGLTGGSASVFIAGLQNNIADIGHWFYNPGAASGTIVGNTAITSGGTISVDGGGTDNNGAYIESMGGTLTINVNAGDLVLTAGANLGTLNCVAEINSLDTQIINVVAGGLTLTQGTGDFAIARIGVANNDQTITVRDNITLQADTTGMVAVDTGAVIENLFVGANTQSIASTQGSILLSTNLGSAANAPVAAITNTGSNQIVQASTGIDLVNNNSGTSGACVVKIGGESQSVTVANGDLTVTGGDSPSCGSELGSSSQIINVPQGAIIFTGGAGTTSIAQATALNGSQTISCGGTLTLQGGPGPGTGASARILHTIAGTQTITVQGDLQQFAGMTNGSTARILSTGPLIMSVGGSATLVGSMAISMANADIQTIGTQTIDIGQNLTLQAGIGPTANAGITCTSTQSITLGGDLHAIGGPGPGIAIAAIRTTAGSDTTITSTGGSVIFRNGTPQTNGAYLQSIVTPPVFSGAGTTITAAGDIALANNLSSARDITINAGTGGNQGAFLVDTRAYPSFAGAPMPALNGITLSTTTGNLTLRAASKFADGSPADFLISDPMDLTYLPLQPCFLTSISGNILVDPFRDVTINTAISTLGDITILADNDIIMTAIASITSANTTLVVDEQGQNGLIGGIWDPTGGDFILNLGATVVGTNTLRVFTAVRPNNTIDGPTALNGNMFVPGTLYIDTSTEQWFTYFGGPNDSSKSPIYTIYYKDFPPSQFVPLLTTASAELFTMSEPYDNLLRWSLNFSEIFSDRSFVPYTINRRIHAEMHNPKTDRVKKWDE